MWLIKELFAWVFGIGINSNLTQYLKISGGGLADGGLDLSSVINAASTFCNSIILPIADCLLIMYFLLNLIEMATNERFNLQQFFYAFAKVIVYHIIVINTFILAMNIFSMGNSLVDEANDIFKNSTNGDGVVVESMILGNVTLMSGPDSEYNEIEEAQKKAYEDVEKYENSDKFMDNLKRIIALVGYIFSFVIPYGAKWTFFLIIPFFISVIAYAAIIMAGLSRAIQIIVKVALAPISFADLYNGGIHGSGMRNIKSLFALAMQGMTIIIIVVVGNLLCGTIYSGGGNIFMGALLVSVVKLTQVSLLGKSLDITKEVIGA